MTQRSQWGATGLQVPWPKATRVELMVSQYWGGSFSLSAISVSSGVRVST